MYRVVIPSRFAATRLPGKPLLQLAGKPMIQWVHEHACNSQAAEVIVATDDERIAAAARDFGADVAMTAAHHASGTDRIAEVSRQRGWSARDVIVNVQGDEPLLPPALIDQVAALLARHSGADMATLATAITTYAEFIDPNVVKLVTDNNGRALYFSRAPIPCDRDHATVSATTWVNASARRHIGIYAYRVAALQRLAVLKSSPLELLEKLEQLRALEHGIEIRVADSTVLPGADVNSPADVAAVAALLASG